MPSNGNPTPARAGTAGYISFHSSEGTEADNAGKGAEPEDLLLNYILLIDDQEDNQYLVQEFLEWKGYRVKVASSGAEGLRLAALERPGMVLMDMTMPIMDGYEATRRMRALPGCENIPIIALTAYDIRDAGPRCIEAGCSAFLAKPFEPDDLLKVVQRYNGRSSPT